MVGRRGDAEEGFVGPQQLQHVGGRHHRLHQLAEIWRRRLHREIGLLQVGVGGTDLAVERGQSDAVRIGGAGGCAWVKLSRWL